MRLLYTSTLCIWDNSTIVLLCFYGDLMKKIYFIKNMLQLLPVTLPLELGTLQHLSYSDEKRGSSTFTFVTSSS